MTEDHFAKGGGTMKLKHVSIAIMITNMLLMTGLLCYTYSIATNMQTITDAVIMSQGY